MPQYKRSNKRMNKKRYFPKKKKRFAKLSTITVRTPSNQGLPFPDRYRCKLTFASRYTFTGGPVLQEDFRGAGAYDPLIKLGGGSPYGFVELSAIYGKYICHGSKIDVKFLSTSNGANTATSGRCVVVPVSQPSAYIWTSAEQAANKPYSKDVLVGPAGATSISRIVSYMSTRKILGLSGDLRLYDDCSSATNTTPVNDWTWSVVAESTDGIINLQSIIAYVKVTYYLEFYDRGELDP